MVNLFQERNMKKVLSGIVLALTSSVVFAHGWNNPHQSYQVQPEAKTIYIQTDINNYRTDVDSFYLTVLENGEQIEFASQQRTYTQVRGSRPLAIGVYVRNDKPLPRTIQVCSASYGKNIDSLTLKQKDVQIRTRVCTLVKLRALN